MGHPWWLEIVNPEGLSQGDIVGPLHVAIPLHPTTFVRKATWPKDPRDPSSKARTGYEVTDARQDHLVVRTAEAEYCLIVAHSCEIDKDSKRVLVAPVALASRLTDANARSKIMAGQRRSIMPLPDVPELGDCTADLRLIQPVDRRALDAAPRIASMTPAGVERLHRQFIGYLIRPPGWEQAGTGV